MVDFRRNKVAKTTRPSVTVDGGLPLGIHRFQLIVANGRGIESEPAEVVVKIVERRLPHDPIRRERPIPG
jgi:hypothetical protein